MHPQIIHMTLLDPKVKIPPFVWRDGVRYYAKAEAARRRGVTRQAVDKWSKRHGDMCIDYNGHVYVPEVAI